MKILYAITAIALVASSASFAADGSCLSKATDKKLSGAAKTSFIQKCERDMAGAKGASDCSAKAAEKKLSGAAKTSFVTKCEKDARASK